MQEAKKKKTQFFEIYSKIKKTEILQTSTESVFQNSVLKQMTRSSSGGRKNLLNRRESNEIKGQENDSKIMLKSRLLDPPTTQKHQIGQKTHLKSSPDLFLTISKTNRNFLKSKDSDPVLQSIINRNSELGSLSTLRKSEFIRSQVILQFRGQEEDKATEHTKSQQLLTRSKFMQDLQIIQGLHQETSDLKNYLTPKAAATKQEQPYIESNLDQRSAENSSLHWPISNKKEIGMLSVTPKKNSGKKSKTSSNDNLKILEYSEVSHSYDAKRKSIDGRLVDKFKNIRCSEPTGNISQDFVTSSMLSKVSDHSKIAKKLDYKNQHRLFKHTPKKSKSSKISAAKPKNHDYDKTSSDEDDQIRYQFDISF